MNYFKVFIFLLIIAFTKCKVQGSAGNIVNSRILGGSAVTITNYPYVASIYYNNYFKCGASIISPSWILTAAFCVLKDLALVKIRVGSKSHNSSGLVVTAIEAIPHELYNFSTFNTDFDIGLYKLKTPLNFTSSVKAIALPTLNKTIPAGTVATFSGWGNTSPAGSLSVNLLAIDIATVTMTTCRQQYAQYFFTVKDMKLCAGPATTTKTVCQGDQGSPLVATLNGTQQQIAILPSIADYCNPSGLYHIFVSVPVLREWIKNKTGV